MAVCHVESVEFESAATAQPGFVSVVMPCLNELCSVAECVRQARDALRLLGVPGEVIVCDNGSTDGSAAAAEQAGATVVYCDARGYGNAIRRGIQRARGDIVVIGDADGSHDFSAIPEFVERLQRGADMVIGNRFQRHLAPGVMHWLNRYVGNPGLTCLVNALFHTGVGDTQCGFRALSRPALGRLHLDSSGMELASEMVVKASTLGLVIAEIPATMRPPLRPGRPHLRPFRDGCRHLTLLLMLSPGCLFVVPALLLLAAGIISSGLAVTIDGLHRGHLLLAIGMVITAAHVLLFGMAARLVVSSYLWRQQPGVAFHRSVMLTRGLAGAMTIIMVGCLLGYRVLTRSTTADEPWDTFYVYVAVGTLAANGVQGVFFTFLYAIIARMAPCRGLRARRRTSLCDSVCSSGIADSPSASTP